MRPHGLCSPPGSSVHGILQARILEWVATNSFPLGIFETHRSNPCLLHWQADSLLLSQPGKPHVGRPLYKRHKNESALVGACPTYIPFSPFTAVTSESPWRLQSVLKTVLLTKKATEHVAYFILVSRNYSLSTYCFLEPEKQNVIVRLCTSVCVKRTLRFHLDKFVPIWL